MGGDDWPLTTMEMKNVSGVFVRVLDVEALEPDAHSRARPWASGSANVHVGRGPQGSAEVGRGRQARTETGR